MDKPNIVFILLDDVGWNDLGYNSDSSPIPTPFIDELALSLNAAYFQQYYVHSLCSPTRAAFLTGRYSVNAGLPYVLVPGSPAGLDLNAETLPNALKKRAGYRTAMSGKWHLGHSKKIQTPIGRGFDVFTGIYTWDADSYTKETFTEATKPPLMIDWVQEFSNGTFSHYAEPRHSTEAITAEAQTMIKDHSRDYRSNPLFLYVAYTAAHSPLQPLQRHLDKCWHISHLWRRQFCGMVVGADEGIKNLTATALQHLGNNTILVVSSDNGGSPWFGGMNQPFRGAKTSPYEGGVRVPAFAVDFTESSKYLGKVERKKPVSGQPLDRGKVAGADVDSELANVMEKPRGQPITFMMHVSDWMPTFLSIAGVSKNNMPLNMDGIDMKEAIRAARRGKDYARRWGQKAPSQAGPRNEMLLELLTADDSVFASDLFAYREGDWKLIYGRTRDPLYYTESRGSFLNTSYHGLVLPVGESILRVVETFVGEGRFDTTRIVLTHQLIHSLLANPKNEAVTKLFNISADPFEVTNLADGNGDVVARLMGKVEAIKKNLPVKVNMRLQFDIDTVWPKTFVSGDCSMNPHVAPENCRFTHPWIADDVDAWAMDGIVDAVKFVDGKLFKTVIVSTIITLVIPLVAIALCLRWLHRAFSKGGMSASTTRVASSTLKKND